MCVQCTPFLPFFFFLLPHSPRICYCLFSCLIDLKGVGFFLLHPERERRSKKEEVVIINEKRRAVKKKETQRRDNNK